MIGFAQPVIGQKSQFSMNDVIRESEDSISVIQQFVEIDLGGTGVMGASINYRFQKKYDLFYLGCAGGIGARQGMFSSVVFGKLSCEGGVKLGRKNMLGLDLGISSLYDGKGEGSSKAAREDFFNGPFGETRPFRPTLEKTIGLGIIYRYERKRFGLGIKAMIIRSYFSSPNAYAIPFAGICLSYLIN